MEKPKPQPKPKVYWRAVDDPDQDPTDACWAVKLPGRNGGTLDVGIGSWEMAFWWAFCMVTIDRIEALGE